MLNAVLCSHWSIFGKNESCGQSCGSFTEVKKYLPSTLETIEKTNQTIESYTKKTVQTHVLAQSFANQLQAKFDEVEYLEPMKLFSYNNIFMGKIEATGEHVITLLW